MKKQRLFVVQIFLLLILLFFLLLACVTNKNAYLEAGAFGEIDNNTGFCDLADRLYTIAA